MREKCIKCGAGFSPVGSYIRNFEQCYSCKQKEYDRNMRFIVTTIMLAIIVVFGVRMFWAKFIYQDARCAFAECRIQVNPK